MDYIAYPILSSIRNDSDRNKTLSGLISVINLESNDIPQIISLYKIDSDRNKALDILIICLKNITSSDLIKTSRYYSFDSERNKGLLILSKKIVSITTSDFVTLISYYKFDSERVIAIKTMGSFIESINYTDISKISHFFNFDSDRAKVIPYLIEKINNPLPIINNTIKNHYDNKSSQKKIELFTLLDELKSLKDDDKIKIIENNISTLDISKAESRCKELKGYFKSDQIFKDACEILGINPDIQEEVKQTIKIEYEQKVLGNELIQIETSFYHKSYFTEGLNRLITYGDLNVEICRMDSCFMIKACRNGGYSSITAGLDDKITIKKSDGINVKSLIGESQINISI